jgi:hypothetical protein
MNTRDELEQLELATSAAPEANLDADTAALRDGWRILSASIEKNAEHFDETDFLSKLQLENGPALPAERNTTETNGKPGGWMVVATLLGGALAASLLLAVALAGGLFSQPHSVKKTLTSHPAPVVESPSRQGIHPQDGNAWSWNDPLDSQISVAATEMQFMQNPALRLDATISTLNYELQRMAEDLDEGAL